MGGFFKKVEILNNKVVVKVDVVKVVFGEVELIIWCWVKLG